MKKPNKGNINLQREERTAIVKTFVTEQVAENFKIACFLNYTDMAKVIRKCVNDYIEINIDGLIEYKEQQKEQEGLFDEYK